MRTVKPGDIEASPGDIMGTWSIILTPAQKGRSSWQTAKPAYLDEARRMGNSLIEARIGGIISIDKYRDFQYRAKSQAEYPVERDDKRSILAFVKKSRGHKEIVSMM